MSDQESKKQILKSTGILGSAQVVIILIGMARVKILAVLLGATGIGIAALYQTTLDLIKWATGFGLGYSAVRDIAGSVTSNDEKRIATTILVLRRWAWATGLLGMVICIVFSRQLSYYAFGNYNYTIGFIVLSVTMLLSSMAGGQAALLQGFRKIGEMAKANVGGALVGLACGGGIYYFWGMKGIVPAIFITNLSVLVLNWYYSRKIKTVPVTVDFKETFEKGKRMATLGFFLTLTSFAGTGSMYLVRAFIMSKGGVDSVGYFVAAWSISAMYLSAIFGAMGADFFPRLSGVQDDHAAVTRLVNEQTEVALLITAPIIIGMVSFIKIVVQIFYSKDFGPTTEILNWQLLGDFFKVLAWPMGFITLAKGKGRFFSVIELSWNAVYCAGVYFGWRFFGIQITGIAFLVAYMLYNAMVFFMGRKLVNFSWSAKVWQYILIFLPLLIFSFISIHYFSPLWHYAVCTLTTLSASIYSLYHLKDMINLKAVLARFGLALHKK